MCVTQLTIMNNKDILIIDGAMVARSPHVATCMNILSENNITFDIIVWNRKGDDISCLPNNYIIYDHITNDSYPSWKKLIEIYQFYRFARPHIKKIKYKAIIIFEIANSFFFVNCLKRQFKNKYIFDIRDYSPFLRTHIGEWATRQLIKHSYCTVISSPGFKKWLPCDYSYIISHNIDMSIYHSLIDQPYRPISDVVTILTIGNLRDPNINCKVALSFSNNTKYQLRFVGDGAALPVIQNFCNEHNIQNVNYFGHYEKCDEIAFYRQSDIINCCMEDNMLSNYLMSNRIYLAALLQKPILCIDGSYQSSIVQKYNLGCVVKINNNIEVSLKHYLENFDYDEYNKGRNSFLNYVREEQKKYIEQLTNIIKT